MSPLALLLFQAAIPWSAYDGVSIPTPPAEHPRLYLRASDLPDLRRRTTHPALKPVWESLQAAGRAEPQLGAEADALRYLLTRDEAAARRAIASALGVLRDTRFDMAKQDITRPIGRLMVTGAVVYDWCYPLLGPDEKRQFVEQLRRLAAMLECGYPPPKIDSITGHYAEWMLMRDLLSAGLAIYDEFPEMYQVAANRFFGNFLPVRNWWYRGGAFHQGTSYAETRFSADLYPLWIFARMGVGNVYDPAQQSVAYQWIYLRRPDGQLLRSGDGQGKEPKLRGLLLASYYKDPYVLADFLRAPSIDRYSLLFEFLWRDPDLAPKPVAELPLARYMDSPYGWMVARSGWGDDSAIAEMKVNRFNFANHQHLDAGAFQIYYKGPLAIDSGLYEGSDGGYGSPHDVNYNKRTIAHNSLLIHDPSEVFQRSGQTLRNDGGQKFPNRWREPRSLAEMETLYRTGEVLGHAIGPDARRPAFTYLKGDITRAYSAKAREVVRSFVYLNLDGKPVQAALAVFDRVVSSDPGFRKTWLLHSMEAPRIEGGEITVAPMARGWQGKLVDRVLLPEQPRITPVGGPGKEFWVDGVNFANRPLTGDAAGYELGEWRVEVSPAQPAAADLFLNVMQVMDRAAAPLPVARIGDEGTVGFVLAGATVLFRRDGQRSGASLTFDSAGARFLAADLAAGRWRILRDGRPAGEGAVAESEGTLWFEGPPGRYTLVRE